MITLRVFLYGLLAFITDHPEKPDDLVILMVDAHRPPIATDGCAMHRHLPLLLHRGIGIDKCVEPCRAERGLCACPLERVEVTVDQADLQPTQECGTECATSALYWFVPRNLGSREGGAQRVRSDCLFARKNSEISSSVCNHITAQVSLQPQDLFVCDMMGDKRTIPEQQRSIDASIRSKLDPEPLQADHLPFTSLVRASGAGREQPVATVLLLTRELSKSSLTFRVVAFDATESFDVKLNQSETVRCINKDGLVGKCLDVIIANIPEAGHDPLEYARCRDHGIARDFELYDDIVEEGADLDNRPVPHMASTDTYSTVPMTNLCASDILLDLVYWLRDVDDIPACPNRSLRRSQ